MSYPLPKNLIKIGYYFILIYVGSSCSPSKNVAYFQDLTDTSKIYSQVINGTYEVQIQPDDILQTIVDDINAEAAAPFNLGNINPVGVLSEQITQGAGGIKLSPQTTNQTDEGYLVDKSGAIDFPVLGSIAAEGLTIPQLKDTLKLKLNKNLKNPIINIRLLNYKVTVLAEVARSLLIAYQAKE